MKRARKQSPAERVYAVLFDPCPQFGLRFRFPYARLGEGAQKREVLAAIRSAIRPAMKKANRDARILRASRGPNAWESKGR